MDKTNLRFDWIGETTIEKHWDDLTRDELLMYVDWLEKRLVKNCSIPDVVGQSGQLVCPSCESQVIVSDKRHNVKMCGVCKHQWAN